MALANTRDPVQSAEQLTRWLADRLPGAQVTDVEIPQASGLSNETLLFTASWDGGAGDFVARVAPQGPGVFPSYDLVTEQRVMDALARHTSVPVPKTPWVETDPGVLGAPFLVMERLSGRVPSDDPPFTAGGWVLELRPEEQARMCDNALDVLTEIHQVDHDARGLGFLHRPGADEPIVLCWGDARVGNMLIADDMTINGVLDWEMVGLGSPDLELGWWMFMLRHHTEGIGAPLPPGFPSREQVIARYEERTGHVLDHLDFYEAFAGLRLSILMHRAGNMMIAAGLLPPDAPMKFNNPASQLLAGLIGAEAPTGAAQSFIGNR